jgi:hypothetical protein
MCNNLHILTSEKWQTFCSAFNTNLFKNLYCVYFGPEIQKDMLAQFYYSNLQIVNLPMNAEDLAYNNRHVLLRYYASLVNYLSSHANTDTAKAILDYVGFPHKKIINHLISDVNSKTVLFTTKLEYEKLPCDDKKRAILIDNDENNLVKQNFTKNKA